MHKESYCTGGKYCTHVIILYTWNGTIYMALYCAGGIVLWYMHRIILESYYINPILIELGSRAHYKAVF